jgi:hypothetical protein
MKWNDVKKDHVFNDGSKVTQRHQTKLYDCYKLTYIDDNNQEKTLVASKDHLIKVNISKLPKKAKKIIKKQCIGKVPLREDIVCEILGYINDEKKKLIYNYIYGNIDVSYFKEVEDISEDSIECYLIKFKDDTYREVFVKRFVLEEEDQKIDENNYWIPVEGIDWLVNTFGEIEI